MKARVAGIAGSVLALTVIGGFAAASTFQSAPAPAPVVVVTVAPTVVETVAPVVAPTTQAPVVKAPTPVESTQAPVQVAPTSEAPVAVKSPAPVKAAPAPPVSTARDAGGNLIPPVAPVQPANIQIDGHGVRIPVPTP
jgi:hypothetical protein